MYLFKGLLCSFEDKIKLRILTYWHIDFSFHKWMKVLFSEENKVPRTLFEDRRIVGSATYEQSKTIWNCVVLYGQFVYSLYSVMKTWNQSRLFSLFRHKKKSVNEDSSPKLCSAPLTTTTASFIQNHLGKIVAKCDIMYERMPLAHIISGSTYVNTVCYWPSKRDVWMISAIYQEIFQNSTKKSEQ